MINISESISRMRKAYLCAPILMGMMFIVTNTQAELPIEEIGRTTLPSQPDPHWVWVSDVVVNHLEAGKAFLIDGDSGDFLGMLSTGVLFMALSLPKDYAEIYSAETYYSRGVRGARSDVVVVYDPVTLLPSDEIAIPNKRGTNFSTSLNTQLTDDDKFMLVYNFTPAQTVSVVDVKQRRFLGEIETAGCALVYASGDRQFFSLCGDGGLLSVHLSEKGTTLRKYRSKPFFDAQNDPIQEDGVRVEDQWIFVSYGNNVYTVDVAGEQPQFPAHWSLLNDSERAEGWQTGGLQLLAAHSSSRRLYVAMHQGGLYSQDDAGTEIWVYDIDTHKRLQRIKTKYPVTSIHVSEDDQPLLFTLFAERPQLDVYDARTGDFLRSVEQLGSTPMVLQTPWRALSHK
ncbi:MAG: methylamine dehydrogenase heavy chain [Planctomycetota bacterium]|jgi:methylamine dehydrogenase heavy chain